ncbi:MAG TPA: DUF4332 domain-containing protein [Leptospiraceae bacterium]|jgi:predicted flap endonuclease-1-like 5' DNA nuclease|nr:ferredoxin [Spirochaetaceae bacterium]HBS05776.1 DUF4332 domain-containing protein [Leptospiraceae bacterium]|tara:strand:- start:598 stop:1002 length:405 start_codon:yes stop_codon:yes gene_type:complete
MAKLNRIEGIDDKAAQKLKSVGITTIEKLLEQASKPQDRKQISKEARVSEKQLLKWVNHADLFRIKGIAGLKAELLEATGVDTIKELAKRKPENLYESLLEMNKKKNFVERVPGMVQVKRWVTTAKRMKPMVKY